MSFRIVFPMKRITSQGCKECGGEIKDKQHGITVWFSSLTHDKLHFHKNVCFYQFQKNIASVDIQELNARFEVRVI